MALRMKGRLITLMMQPLLINGGWMLTHWRWCWWTWDIESQVWWTWKMKMIKKVMLPTAVVTNMHIVGQAKAYFLRMDWMRPGIADLKVLTTINSNDGMVAEEGQGAEGCRDGTITLCLLPPLPLWRIPFWQFLHSF